MVRMLQPWYNVEIFSGINLHQWRKGCLILYTIINTGQNIRAIKLLPMRSDGEIGEICLLVKIPRIQHILKHKNCLNIKYGFKRKVCPSRYVCIIIST